jgi:hypothetical protein
MKVPRDVPEKSWKETEKVEFEETNKLTINSIK